MPSESASSSSQQSLEAYLDDAMGVRFGALSRFAQPLFELYGIDLQSSLAKPPATRSAKEVNVLLTVLDTARLFWAYFSLDAAHQDQHAADLKACLVGPAPDADAEDSFQELMDLMRERWTALPNSLRHHAQATVPSTLPSFEALLDQHGGPSNEGSAHADGYGADQLEKPEALALFAQPLLEDPEVHVDPDVLEQRMALATAYWELAHADASHRDQMLQTLLHRFADSPDDRDALQQQAHEMLRRFEDLFPEHAA